MKKKIKTEVKQTAGTENSNGQFLPPPEKKQLSRPYIVRVKNASDSVENVSLFGEVYNISKRNNNWIHLSSGFPNIDYSSILWQFMGSPVTIDRVHIYVISGNVKKVIAYMMGCLVQTRDANGTTVTVPISTLPDPYQVQEGVLLFEREFSIDGQTQFDFKLPPESEVLISLYPAAQVNISRALIAEPIVMRH